MKSNLIYARTRKNTYGSMDKMKSNLIYAAFAMIAFLFSAKAFSSQQYDPYVEFMNRFGPSSIFSCHRNNHHSSIAFSVSSTEYDSPGVTNYNVPKGISQSEKAKLLSAAFYSGDNRFLFASWGLPQFDQSMKFMSIKLNNGKTLVFKRFRDIPISDTDEKHFDSKPFFYLTIDNEPKLSCGQTWNNGAF